VLCYVHVGLVDFHFLLSTCILCVLLILSKLIRATIGVLFVPCCPVLLSFYLVLYYIFELNKWRWRDGEGIAKHSTRSSANAKRTARPLRKY